PRAAVGGASAYPEPTRNYPPSTYQMSKAPAPASKPTPKSVIEMARKKGVVMVDVKFVDTFGTWQHFSVPVGELTEDVFADGFGFDGSSIRGWKSIEASDMLAMPDPQ